MNILLTGCNGFAGQYAARDLAAAGHSVIGGDIQTMETLPSGLDGYIRLDVTAPESVESALSATQPDAVLHLGGIAFVPTGWSNPQLVFQTNTIGTLNILTGIREHCPAARLLFVSSAEVYGSKGAAEPMQEDRPLTPDNPYGVSKAAAEEALFLYAQKNDLDVITARPSNHIGPGQAQHFVATSFAAQLARMNPAYPDTMNVGNLDQQRDFTDVRDVVRAYRLLLEKGNTGKAYNIARGQMTPIREILDLLCDIAGIRPPIEIDPALYRPLDHRPAYNIERIAADVGWQPEIPLRHSLETLYTAIKTA